MMGGDTAPRVLFEELKFGLFTTRLGQIRRNSLSAGIYGVSSEIWGLVVLRK